MNDIPVNSVNNPFTIMKIDNNDILQTLNGRSPCPQCYKSRKFFCYTCYVPILELQGILPRVKLPLKIDIIKHKHEIDGKSTAIHAAILAPEDVRIFTYPDIPDYTNEQNVVLVFPSSTSVQISNLFNIQESVFSDQDYGLPKGHNVGTLLKKPISINNPEKSLPSNINCSKSLPVSRAVFIDSTWNQSRGIFKDERLRKLKSVVLQNRVSQFWRHQKGSPRWYLATIEAVHQFLVEVHVNAWGLNANYDGLDTFEGRVDYTDKIVKDCFKAYNGQYDNLLFFFSHMYKLIHTLYDHNKLKSYKRPLL